MRTCSSGLSQNNNAMQRNYPFLISQVGCLLLWFSLSGLVEADDAQRLEYFEKQVRPLLAEHCYQCHSASGEEIKGGLRVDHLSSMLTGGDSGPALVPGQADTSLLMEAVRYESYEMPPKGKLAPGQLKVLETWINEGAFWPEEEVSQAGAGQDDFNLEERKQSHWIWQPITDPAEPATKDSNWAQQPLDHFILARLEQNNLEPAAAATRRTLIRRLYFDLIGLPPRPSEVEKYLAGDEQKALEQLVDDLLASPHFGERWGRHWLDLVRYAESRGHEFDNDARNAYQYRDYVIRALNADVPYDQFVREHIAGDVLDNPRLNPERGFNESVLGTGFWFLGEWVHSPVDIRKDESDRFDNMIDVMSKTFLGVTVACARCHDHKFDAISTADYYSLSGFLQGSDYRQVRFETIEHNRQVAEKLAVVDREYERQIAELLAEANLEKPASATVPGDVAAATIFDFGEFQNQRFLQDGFAFGDGPREVGKPWLAEDESGRRLEFEAIGTVSSDPFWNGLKSISEKGVHNRSRLSKLPRSGRTFRTPTFELTSPHLACSVEGAGHIVAVVDSHRLIAGPLHGETIAEVKPGQSHITLKLGRYVGHRIHLEFTPAANASLSVSRVLSDPSGETVKHLSQYEKQAREQFRNYAEQAQNIVPEQLVAEWAAKRSQLQSEVQRESRLAMAMFDGTGENDHILIRGNSSRPGAEVDRRFLSAVDGDAPLPVEQGSGRLELAERINAAENPLPHRVIVNRIWHHLMGRGIVATTADFGVLGQRPTHPQLLDHLASRFLKDGRSIKQMIRYIVLSSTYQMGSKPSEEAMRLDPLNELRHYRPLRRLEGEVIRDTLLTLSGKLNNTQFGEPVPIHLTAFMEGRGRPGVSGPADGNGRRSIYISVRRNFLSPFMLAFDTPVPFSTMGTRTSSNVPAQALILMNDPFVAEQTRLWAERTIQSHADVEARITSMYETALARPPRESELAAVRKFVEGSDEAKAWRDLAQALVNTKEFIFIP